MEKHEKAQRKETAEERLQELYESLAEVIPEALAEDFVGMGYAKGKYYDSAEKRILVVEKIPRPDVSRGCGCGGTHVHGHSHGHDGDGPLEDEKDFTAVVSRLVRELLGVSGEDWQQYTAWTYLYKLAPKTGKPDGVILGKQKALCQEIIKAEIQVMKPTHVLFLTGWGSVWDWDLPLFSLLKGEAVEAWGETEEDAKLIVTRYAVRRPEDKFAMDILEKIRLLEEMECPVSQWQQEY